MAHLWEVKHDYYCQDTNYFSSEKPVEFRNWQSFLTEYEKADMDYNLVFRWDWKDSTVSDNELKQDELHIYTMWQRKGRFVAVIVNVFKEDEQLVIDWLKPRFEHLMKLWQPIELQPEKLDNPQP